MNKYYWEQTVTTEDLLLGLVKDGDEKDKVDFKLTYDISGGKKEKSELVRDITSIANSYSLEHENHGFLIFGIHPTTKEIEGVALDKESLVTHIDKLIETHVSPRIFFKVETFETPESKQWCAIIIKPSVAVPHVFISDSSEFNKGEVWVRKGTFKGLASSDDYARFFSVRTESLKQEMEARMYIHENMVKGKIAEIEKKMIDLGSKSTRTEPAKKVSKTKKVANEPDEIKEIEIEIESDDVGLDILVKKSLPKQSPLKSKLIEEVNSCVEFLKSESIPWGLHISESNKDQASETVQKIQFKFEQYYKTIFELAFFGNQDDHIEIISDSVKKLAVHFDKGGVTYDALYIRYLPIVTTLHILSIATVFRRSEKYINIAIDTDLSNKERRSEKHSVTDTLFYIRRASNLFDALHPNYPKTRWHDGPGSYQKEFLMSLLTGYTEIDDPVALFYQGEFLLSLTPIIADSESGIRQGHVSSGSYMDSYEARAILEDFLKSNVDLLKKIFSDLKAVMKQYDEDAPKISNRGMRFSDGVPRVTQTLFPSIEDKKVK